MSSLTVRQLAVSPSPATPALQVFMQAAVKQAHEVLEASGYLKSLPAAGPVDVGQLNVPTGLFLDEIEGNPERAGKRAGYALAARIVASTATAAKSAAPATPKGPITCGACQRKSGAQATKCMYCGAAFAAPVAAGGPGREAVLGATFGSKGDANEKGIAAQEIDRQFAQAVLEQQQLATRVAVLDLGTAVRAPRSDLDYGLAIEGTGPAVSFPQIESALKQAGFEANAASLQNVLLNLDQILAQARSGALSTILITKFLKAELLAGAPSAAAKLLEIKRAIITNPAYRKWHAGEVKKFAARTGSYTGDKLTAAFHLKDTPGGIRDIQQLSWLSAMLSGRAPGSIETFDGLVEKGLITAAEGQQLASALVFFREVRRWQHLKLGKEKDDFVPGIFAEKAEQVASTGGQHAAHVRAILEKVGKQV